MYFWTVFEDVNENGVTIHYSSAPNAGVRGACFPSASIARGSPSTELSGRRGKACRRERELPARQAPSSQSVRRRGPMLTAGWHAGRDAAPASGRGGRWVGCRQTLAPGVIKLFHGVIDRPIDTISTSISFWLMAKLVALLQSPRSEHRGRIDIDGDSIFLYRTIDQISMSISSRQIINQWDARARVQTSPWSTRCRYNLDIHPSI